MEIPLIALSILALAAGFLFLNDATTGVGIIGIAGVQAIFARIAQAQNHHKEIKRILAGEDTSSPKPPTLSDLGRMRKEHEAEHSDS